MKIVQLTINMLDELTGVNAVALVEQPAIESDFMAFNNQSVEDLIVEKLIELELTKEDKHFDNLSKDEQEDLLAVLQSLGKSEDEWKKQGYLFGVTTSDANPQERTQEQVGNMKYLYKYIGPRDSKNRSFCRRLLDLNLLFRKEDISKLTMKSANNEFGFYDIFTYKGSFNCRHEWRKVLVLQEGKSSGIDNIREVENIGETQSFTQSSYKFAIDEDKKVVVGPAMIPSKLILRVDQEGEPYYVYFTEETIRTISEKMFKTGQMNNLNLEHSQEDVVEGYLMESWIVEDKVYDKSNKYGFNLPIGTLMTMYKIEDDNIWSMIKQGEIKGFSVEGYFNDKLISE